MRTLTSLFLCILLCQPITNAQSLNDKVDQLLDPLVNTRNYSGTYLVAIGDSVVLSGAVGQANLEGAALTKDSKFMLASTSMIFTSMAIMKLVDEEKLSLDTKLSEYVSSIEGADQITIHHMLAQRSGLQKIEDAAGVMNFNYKDNPQKLEDLAGFLDGKELIYKPGSQYFHGRSDYILLARIVEIISGKSFGDYLSQEIFKPLEMNDSGHIGPEAEKESIQSMTSGMATEGFIDLVEAPYLHWSSKGGHASIYSTVEDLHKFGIAVLNRKLLSAEAWEAVLTNHGDNAGYGLFVRDAGIYALNGRSPGYSSYLTIDPESGMITGMLGNIYNSLPFFTGPKLEAIVKNEPYDVQNLSTKDIDKSTAAMLKGSYQFGPDFYRPNGKVSITYKDGKLYSGGAAMIPVIDQDGYIIEFINRSYWSTLKFIKDKNGNATHLMYDDYEGVKSSSLPTWVFPVGLAAFLISIFIVYRGIRKRQRSSISISG